MEVRASRHAADRRDVHRAVGRDAHAGLESANDESERQRARRQGQGELLVGAEAVDRHGRARRLAERDERDSKKGDEEKDARAVSVCPHSDLP